MNGQPIVPPAAPPSPQPPPARRVGSLVLVVLAWVVILGVVGLIMWAGLRPRTPEPSAGSASSSSSSRAAATELLIESRVQVGFAHLVGNRNAGKPPAGRSLAASLDHPKRSTADRLRLVTVVGELSGGKAALKRLDELDKQDLPKGAKDEAQSLRVIYTTGPAALTPVARQQLVDRAGWFGQLALTHGLPDDDPARRAVLAPAIRAAWASLAVLGVGAIGFVVGLVILVIALVAYFDGKLRVAYRPPPVGRSGPFVEAFALYMVGMVVVSAVLYRLLGKNPSLAANFWIALALPLPLIWPRLRGLGWSEIRAGFGWHAGRGIVREAACGVVGYVAGLPLLVIAVLVTSILSKLTQTTPTHPIVGEAAGPGLTHVLLLYGLASVFAPLAEETMFRGALYHHVRRGLPWWFAGPLVALIFAAIHPQGWVGIPVLATIAIVLAALREWRGSLVASIVCHACVNGVTLTMLVMMTG